MIQVAARYGEKKQNFSKTATITQRLPTSPKDNPNRNMTQLRRHPAISKEENRPRKLAPLETTMGKGENTATTDRG